MSGVYRDPGVVSENWEKWDISIRFLICVYGENYDTCWKFQRSGSGTFQQLFVRRKALNYLEDDDDKKK